MNSLSVKPQASLEHRILWGYRHALLWNKDYFKIPGCLLSLLIEQLFGQKKIRNY